MKNNFAFAALIIVITILSGNSVIAQKVTKENINGAEYYVYPFRTEVNYHSAYFLALRGAMSGGGSMKSWFISMNNGVFDKKMYKSYKKYMKQLRGYNRSSETKHLQSRKFKKAVRNNPYPLLEKRYTLDKDIVPSLDKIPDGKYVQYYDSFAMITPKGKTELTGNKISGYFTIKDNMLEGEACWLSIDGDTLKKGMFVKGLKVGEWMLQNRRMNYSISKEDTKMFIERGYPDMDTSTEYVTYSNGVMNGLYRRFENSEHPVVEGNFKDNEEVGQWLEREIRYSGFGTKRIRIRNNNVVTFRYTPEKSNLVVHDPVIRFRLINNDYDDYSDEFDFDSKYYPDVALTKIYSLHEEESEEESLELDEEKIGSYEGSEEEYMDEEMYYEEEEMYGDMYVRSRYNYETGKYITYPELIDSIGITFNYSGLFEKYYPNGQLMMRYEFKDGKLLEEDTIFWDNGNPYDVIEFHNDSSQYIQTVYDYSGTLYKQIVFDSTGEFVRVNFEPQKLTYLTIDGFLAEHRGPYDKYFFYDKLDTLSTVLEDSLVIFRSWYQMDTSLLYSRSYSPKDKKLNFSLYSVMGKPSLEAELLFAEDFLSWTGWKNYYANEMKLATKSSASLITFYTADSFPQNHVNSFDDLFELSEVHTLFRNNKEFSGDVEICFAKKKFSMKTSESSFRINFPEGYKNTMKLQKDLMKYRKTGKTKNEQLLSIVDASELDEEFGMGIFNNLFGSYLMEFIEYPYSGYNEYGESEYNLRSSFPVANHITGKFVAGKPDGIWKIEDQFGKLMMEIPYVNGEVNGTVKQYNYASPAAEYDYMNPNIGDTLPSKKKYYLQSTTDYKNGLRNGKSTVFNWLGEIVAEENYMDGMAHGPAFERNKLAHTTSNYLEGALDGYVRTYLTLPHKDSMLLFDLNFQNGLLQGESKSYHTNGRIAKRGFFLNGESIDDYEAFDTLGFKYHYVKFLYSYPVEEKIWEENELSVRYMFDWRDSIYFVPTDITSTQSLEQVLYDLGLGAEFLERPYYGRPSLIEKKGIDYHMTKYYPNDTVARDGLISSGKKVGCWKYYSYEGDLLYEVDYFDTIIALNDSVHFKSKGILTDYNNNGDKISESYVIEKFEKYDCSHTDHYEIRQLMTFWQSSDTLNLMNGYVKNHYDNGVLQNEGMMKDGLPTGVWKFYDPYGKLNQVGEYVTGKRHGRWLGGDLSKTKYLGDICLNPNLPDLEEEIRYREKLLDIVITNYRMGKALNKEFYDVNLNNYEDEEGEEEEIIEEE